MNTELEQREAGREGPESCQRCGRNVPTRMRGTGFCTVRCVRLQRQSDAENAENERQYVEAGEALAEMAEEAMNYIAEVAARGKFSDELLLYELGRIDRAVSREIARVWDKTDN